jgi:hypothetical protein
MHVTIQTRSKVVRAFSRCQERHETGNVIPKPGNAVRTGRYHVAVCKWDHFVGASPFLRIGFVWLPPQNVLRMNQRSET